MKYSSETQNKMSIVARGYVNWFHYAGYLIFSLTDLYSCSSHGLDTDHYLCVNSDFPTSEFQVLHNNTGIRTNPLAFRISWPSVLESD